MNQVELEKEMADGGRARAIHHLRDNEENGRAFSNPYAQAVYRRFVIPLSEAISTYVGERRRGVQAVAKSLLRDHDPLALAFITVRTVLGETCTGRDDGETTLTRLAGQIGRSVYGEEVLRRFEEIQPAYYFTLVRDFERRMSKGERHRLVVFKREAKKLGISLPVWTQADIHGTGLLLLNMARDLGLIVIEERTEKRKTLLTVDLTQDVRDVIQQVSGFVVGMTPTTLPCVEPPRPWTHPNDGGYHTKEMRRSAPCIIRGQPVAEDGDVPQIILDTANKLQSAAWQINAELLDAVLEVQEHFDVGEVLSQAEVPKPPTPIWLAPEMKAADMQPQQLTEFIRWKAEVREWHTLRKIRGVRWGRYFEAIRIAQKMRDCPQIYFVYQCDYRGRFYAITRGVSPQGSDLQKALIRAAEGKPLDSDSAVRWFFIAGANRFGFDKAPLHERVEWVRNNSDRIVACAEDPVSNRDWTEADAPFQFLAWAMEYRDFLRLGNGFVTRLPVGLDGSCNGLQHFSAMLRDGVGGAATNLTKGDVQQDIYGLVAEKTALLIQGAPEDEAGIAARWKKHHLTRGLVKRSVMTLPYGSTRFSCAEFIQKEYLIPGLAPEFKREEYGAAATWLSYYVWEAIGKVVIKALEAMQWLQRSVSGMTQADLQGLAWRAPSGLLVRQRYLEQEVVRINTRLSGGVRIRSRLSQDTDKPDLRRHKNGVAPNFVHACDAAHLHRLVVAADAAGIDFLAMVHDDYGTLAPDTERLYRLIRETFVAMYEEVDPLLLFKEAVPSAGDPPAKGDLNIREVLDSIFFFA